MRIVLLTALIAACACDRLEGNELGRQRAAVFGGALDTTTSGVVMLFDGPADGPRSLCSAVVLAPRIAVTAAHCVSEAKPYRVQLGNDETSAARSIAVASVAIYPRYTMPGDDQRAGFDLAVVTLADDAGVAPIPIATSDTLVDGANVTVIGFGQSDKLDGASIGARRSAVVPVSRTCARLFGTGTDAAGFCGGDSGGAVISNGVLVGVIGFGLERGCAPPGYATRVAPYARWLQSFIEGAPDTTCASTCPPDVSCTFTGRDAGVVAAPPAEESSGCTSAHAPANGGLWLALLLLRTRTSRRTRARTPARTPGAGTAPSRRS